MTICPARKRLPALAAALAASLFLAGCALFQGASPDGLSTVSEVRSAYALAVDSYQAGQYEKAQNIFQRLSGTTLDAVVARKAYFGLACSRFATARTREDLQAALTLWNTWAQMSPEGLPSEDPRLLTPLLPRLAPAHEAGSAVPLLSDQEIERELLRSQRLTGCQEETGKLKDLLRKKTAEAESLRSQLNALDKLHQEITIKKKGLE